MFDIWIPNQRVCLRWKKGVQSAAHPYWRWQKEFTNIIQGEWLKTKKWYPTGVCLTFENPIRGCAWGEINGLKGGTSLLTLTERVPISVGGFSGPDDAVGPAEQLREYGHAPWLSSPSATSNGSWCMGIKGEMSGTVCVTFTWYMYIYELFIAFVCFVVCSLL